MRYINTKKNFVQLVEVDDNNGKILSSRGFQFGELYFQIKNKKVTFYLNDSEVPYRNDIWTVNIPLQINDEVYDDEESASDALGEIMNDSFQEQLDELKEGLAAESARAEEAEEQLDSKIDDETSRAISAETHLQDNITELSSTVATFDGRITKNTNDISALTSALQVEVERAIAKDATHDAQISGLTTNLQNESARAISAETQLHNDIINEQNRALAAESSITENLNSEISRSTEKDAQHDAQISALTVSLDNEINRATEAENDLRSDLNDEIADRISGDTNLQNQLDAEITRAQNAEEDLDDKVDAEISRANTEETRIEGKLDTEITRSTAKDVEHDTLISGLTDDLASEVSRATAKENQLDAKIDAEIANRISDVDAEETRALAAESALTDAINAEVTRSTNKDASQDALISGLSTSIQNEITRATGAENSLRNDLNAEVSARTTTDNSLIQRVTAVEVGKADANSVYTKQESDDKYATKEYMSGFSANYYDKNATNALLDAKADKANAVASAEYLSNNKIINFKNISGTVISSIDATAFIKDGMVDTVSISGSNLVITFNTDAGKEPISIPLTDIFNPDNYYTKSEVNSIEDAQNSKINEISGKTDDVASEIQILSGEVQTISGESVTTGEVQTMIDESISGKADSNNVYSKTESDNKYQLKGDYVTGAQMSAFTYTKSEVNGLVADKADTTALTQVNNALTAHTANTTVHVTASEKSTWNGKQNQLTAGTGISIQNDVISVTATSPSVDAYTKAESDAKFATITNFNSHSGNTNIHVTASEKQLWNNKSDFSGSYNDLTNKPTIPNYTAGSGITISNNVISAKIWQGTQSQYDALTSKDNDTIYLVY